MREERLSWTHWVLLLCRLAGGAIFIYAGYQKILDPAKFVTDVGNYKILPEVLLPAFALILPWLETICGILFILGFWSRACGVILSGLMGVFIVAVLQAMARGLNFECGCFGEKLKQGIGWLKVLENTLMLLPCIIPAIWGPGKISLDDQLHLKQKKTSE